MSLIISKYFGNISEINTTADINLQNYIKAHTFDTNIIKTNNLEYSNIDIKKHALEKYNINLKNIVILDHVYISEKTIIDDDINIYIYIIDIHLKLSHIMGKYFNRLNFILPYAYFFNMYTPTLKNRLFFYPHSLIHNCDINNNPIKKVLLSGRGRKNACRYPDRTKMYDLFIKNNNYIDYFRPDVSYKININDYNSFTIGKKFILELNKYLVCFCDNGNSNSMPSIFAKFFEIMSSGALLISPNKNTKKYFEKLGFYDRVHYYSMKEDFMKDIKYVLDPINREEIDKIRKNGYEKV